MSKSFQNHQVKDENAFWLLNPASKLESIVLSLVFLLLPTQLGKHFWPDFALVHGIRIDYLSPTLYLTDLLLLLLFLCAAIRLFRNPFQLTAFTAQMLVGVIFIIVLLINSLWVESPLLHFYGLIKLIEFVFFGLYLATTVTTRNQVVTISMLLSVSAIVTSCLAIFQYLNQASLNGLFYFLGERTFTGGTPGIANVSLNGDLLLRPYATFPHPNVLAGYLLVVIIFVWFFVLTAKQQRIQLLGGITVLLTSIALLLTFSRIAILLWILLLGLLFLKLLLRKMQIPRRYIAGGVILILLLCYFAVSQDIITRFTETSIAEEAISHRVVLLQRAIAMFFEQFISGVGLLHFIPSLGPLQAPLSIGLYFQPVHNIYLLTASETGVIGLIVFLGLLILTYRHILLFNTSIMLPLCLVLSIILLIGLVDHYWLTLQQGQLLFATVLGLSWTTVRKM